MSKKSLFIAGHQGLVGRALLRYYDNREDFELITLTRKQLDLTDPKAVLDFFKTRKPEYVILAAAKVGGIKAAYTYPVEFLLENLKIQNSVLEAAYLNNTKKLLFLGSTCVYPKEAPIPIVESSLLSGPMEMTNESYSVAKIAGIKLCQAYRRQYGKNFIVAMPCNLYGPYDNFDPEHSHVLPSVMRRFHTSSKRNEAFVTLWGTGNPRREFLFADDLASACAHLLDHYDGDEMINVGRGEDHSIKEIAELMREITGYRGEIRWDTSKPDGNPRRLLDISKLSALGWKAKTPLRQGLEKTFRWFLENVESVKS